MKDRTMTYINRFKIDNPHLKNFESKIIESIKLICENVQNKQILVCGNGGSAADSEHIAGELLKSFVLKRKVDQSKRDLLIEMYGEDGEVLSDGLQDGIKCIPLTSFTALNTAYINDCKPDLLYAQLVNVLGGKDDVLIAISTSGNSKNVCYAAQLARAKGMKVISLTGRDGGKLKELSSILFNVNEEETFKVQEDHIKIYHLLCLCLESEIFKE